MVWLYLLNACMVAVDGILAIRNTWLDKKT
ncbi:MAG: hypothetical protein BWX70_00770 [Verrucomicrobia bacterium ADurb.Bin070]|nr:MAG: hypothetical protein BWX70_00770 [Verrucomicrobia bacterium ADurb.Bin070]